MSDAVQLPVLGMSGLSVTQLNSIVAGTALAGLGQAFADAEALCGLSSLFLLARAAVDSNWGQSDITKLRNAVYRDMANDYTTKYEAVMDYADKFDAKSVYPTANEQEIMNYEYNKLANKTAVAV